MASLLHLKWRCHSALANNNADSTMLKPDRGEISAQLIGAMLETGCCFRRRRRCRSCFTSGLFSKFATKTNANQRLVAALKQAITFVYHWDSIYLLHVASFSVQSWKKNQIVSLIEHLQSKHTRALNWVQVYREKELLAIMRERE